jgi:DNA modification methylase
VDVILQGHALDVLRTLPSESVSCVVTSPPYYFLRSYGTDPVIWDADPDCEHEWNIVRVTDPNGSGGKTDFIKNTRSAKGKENISEYVDYKDRAVYSNFCPKCNAWKGELGSEPTVAMYIDHLTQIFSEVKRVLRSDGCLFLNIADKYGGSGNGSWNAPIEIRGKQYRKTCNTNQEYLAPPLPHNNNAKSLLLMPERLAIAMTDSGWILRNVLIWQKNNSMPESVKDRWSRSFEYIYFFTKSRKYYFEQQFEPLAESTLPRMARGVSENNKWVNGADGQTKHAMSQPRPSVNKQPYSVQPRDKEYVEYRNLPPIDTIKDYLNNWRAFKRYTIEQVELILQSQAPHHWFSGESYPSKDDWIKIKTLLGFDDKYDKNMTTELTKSSEKTSSPLGRNARNILNVNTRGYKGAHFATFNTALITPLISAGCPEFICTKCGKPREKIYETTFHKRPTNDKPELYKQHIAEQSGNREIMTVTRKGVGYNSHIGVGYTTCGCDNPTYDAGVVMDPFAGTCTTAVAAKQLNRHWLMLELKPEYIKMGEERIAKEGVPKPKRKTKADKQAEYEQWLEERQLELF